MPRNGHTNGHLANGPIRRVDSRNLSAEEIGGAMDSLLATQQAPQEREQFPQLVRLLDGVAKVNPHQHITGSVGGRDLLQLVIQTYQHDPASRTAFLDYAASQRMVKEGDLARFFLQSQDDLLNWFESRIPLPGDPEDFKDADDRLGLVRLAFQSETPESVGLLREAYRTVALENAAHGVEEVWFRTSLGDHENSSFWSAAAAALDGAGEVNGDSSVPINVRFLVGLRKHSPDIAAPAHSAVPTDTRAEKLVNTIAALRERMPGGKRMVLGIDSVGMDAHWHPEWQASARSVAVENRLHVAVHFGESWQEGELSARLEMLRELVNHGAVHQLDNANSLFAVKELLSPHQQYSNDEWVEIRRLQVTILQTMAERGIVVGINPTSNDLLTRSLRLREGWRFRPLTEPLGVGQPSVADLMLREDHGHPPLIIVVGNDNSRLYPSRVGGAFLTVSEELANLWDAPGSINFSVYGKLSSRIVGQLIHNGFTLTQVASNGWFYPSQQSRAVSPGAARVEVPEVVQYPHVNHWPSKGANEVPGDSTPSPGKLPGAADDPDGRSGELEH